MIKVEQDDWWWELLRFDELGLPASWNFIVPDKLMHLLATFLLCWAFSKRYSRNAACLMGWFVMMVPWEVVWDGMFRHGISIPDMVANTLGASLCWWWLESDKVGQR
mgnify:CR=1 FL=1